MSDLSLVISIGSGIICLLGGLFYGILPVREEDQTANQRMWSRAVALIVFGIVIVLILAKEDAASWIAIAATFAGFGIGKIPLLRNFVRSHWKLMRTKPQKSHKTRSQSRKRR